MYTWGAGFFCRVARPGVLLGGSMVRSGFVPLSARSVLWSAFHAGALRSVCLRPSTRSGSGFVAAFGFASFASASRLAARLARRLPPSAAPRVRPVAGASAAVAGWVVSVPVAVEPAGAFVVRGGVRGVAALARGLAS